MVRFSLPADPPQHEVDRRNEFNFTFFSDDDEQPQVNRVNAFAQNAALTSSLAAGFKERNRILEVIGIDIAAKRLDRLQRNAVAGIDISHFPFADDNKRFFMNPVLPRIQTEMNTATEKPGLVTSLTVARDDLSFAQRTFAAPDFLDDPNLSVRNVNNSKQTRQ